MLFWKTNSVRINVNVYISGEFVLSSGFWRLCQEITQMCWPIGRVVICCSMWRHTNIRASRGGVDVRGLNWYASATERWSNRLFRSIRSVVSGCSARALASSAIVSGWGIRTSRRIFGIPKCLVQGPALNVSELSSKKDGRLFILIRVCVTKRISSCRERVWYSSLANPIAARFRNES